MIRKLKWFWIGLLLLLLVYLPFQIPWNASVERPILAQLKKDGIDPVPRTASGQIDFVAIVNQSHYASPDENMFFDVVRLFGPKKNTSPESLEFLGNPQIEEDPLVTVDEFIRDNHPEFSDDEVDAISDRVQEKPWTNISEPVAAEWLERYGDLIDQLVRASQKPKFFCPLGSPDSEFTLLSTFFVAEAHSVREAARILCCQLYFHLGNNDLDRAIANYVAIQNYGLAMMEGPFLINQLIGIATCGIGYETLSSVLEADSINEQQLETLKTVFATAASRQAGNELKVAEKYFLVESMRTLSADGGGNSAADAMSGNSDMAMESMAKLRRLINWETAVVECMKRFESAEKCWRIENDRDRLTSLQQWESEMEEAGAALNNTPGVWLKLLAGARPRGQLAGQVFSSRSLSSISRVESAAIRTRIQIDISRIGVAIELHRLKHGIYPEKLDELVPGFLDAVPIDRYTNGPLTYVKTDTHYFVCSVGPDQIDSIQQVIQGGGLTSSGVHVVDDMQTLLKVKLKD